MILTAVLLVLNITSEIRAEDPTILELFVDAVEIILMMTGVVGVALIVERMRSDHAEKLELIENLAIARAEGADWRQKVESQVTGIGAAMEQQFRAWGLTSAEREVGLLMLKGLSHKEIAALRSTSESTVRQQARTIYQKSNLPGRSAFSAYFLEDLLPPPGSGHEVHRMQNDSEPNNEATAE